MAVTPTRGLSPDDDALLERLATTAVRMGMGVPAVFMLEAAKPLNYVGSQVMVMFGPIVGAFFRMDDYQRLAALLERRDTLEALIVKIERAMDEASSRSRR